MRLGCDVRKINIPFLTQTEKVFDCSMPDAVALSFGWMTSYTIFKKPMRLRLIKKAFAVYERLQSLSGCSFLEMRNGCDVLKKNPPFFDADEKVLDCHKSRCGCTLFRMDDELPHIPKTLCGCRLSAEAMRSHCFFPMSADACRLPTDRPDWAVRCFGRE